MKYFLNFRPLALCILFYSQITTSTSYLQEVDDQLAFSVGDIVITKYEVEKNLTRAIKSFKDDTGFLPSEEWIKETLVKYIDRTYFLEDARKKGYYHRTTLEYDVASVARIIVTQENGLLHKDIVKNVTVSESEIREAYEKSRLRYMVSLIIFENHEAMMRSVGRDSTNVSKNLFRELYQRFEILKQCDASCQKLTTIWPFWNLTGMEEIIINLPEDMVSGPIYTINGIYYVLMEKKEMNYSLKAINEVQNDLCRRIKYIKELKIKVDFQSTVIRKANISIRDKAFNNVFGLLQKNDGLAVTYSNVPENNITLFSYRFNGRLVEVTVGEFLRFCELKFQIEKIDSRSAFKKRITGWVYEMCAYAEAEIRGLTRTKQFVLDRRNYLNSAVYNTYEKDELSFKGEVKELDMQKEYSLSPDRYKDGVCSVATCFKFSSLENARMGVGAIFQQFSESGEGKKKDWMPNKLEGLISVTQGYTVNYDTENLPVTTKETLFKLLPNQFSQPLDMGDRCYGVFVKERETGIRTKSFVEAENEIRTNIIADRLEKNKEMKLNELKLKYFVHYVVPKEKLLRLVTDKYLIK